MLKDTVLTKGLTMFQVSNLIERNCVMSFGSKMDDTGHYRKFGTGAGMASHSGDVRDYWI